MRTVCVQGTCRYIAGMHRQEPTPETDVGEIRASREIYHLLEFARQRADHLELLIRPERGSPLERDGNLCPELKVDHYAHALLTASFGSLDALYRVLGVKMTEETVEMTAMLHGSYDLIRNALETAAHALWILEPQNSMARVKRRLMMQVDEYDLERKFVEGLGWSSRGRDYSMKLANLDRFADAAGIDNWPSPKRPSKPSTTNLIQGVSAHDPLKAERIVSWLNVWRLCSGFAHGKVWAIMAAHFMEESPVEGSDYDLQARVTISFRVLAGCLRTALCASEVAFHRYRSLLEAGPTRRLEAVKLPREIWDFLDE